MRMLSALFGGNSSADRVVPRHGFAVRLTVFTAAAMAFLTVFALALSLAAGRMAANWGDALARNSTLRISAPAAQLASQTERALAVLSQTPGVASARALSQDEQRSLLEPWFGPDLPLDSLPVPQLIDIQETAQGYDADGLRLRLQAEVPGAVLDQHTRWRRPLIAAAARLRLLGWVAMGLIGGAMAAMVTLAAHAALAANRKVIEVLRLVGATDDFIARAFVRRFTLLAGMGALLGAGGGVLALALMPGDSTAGGLLTALRFAGWHWGLPLLVPPLAAAAAYLATRTAARRVLEGLS